MAGTWLKMRHDLEDAPEVPRIARAAGIDPDATLGKLYRIWSWFDRHASAEGRIQGAELEDIDHKARAPGFAAAMAAAGWLVADADGLAIPNWERHNGEGAKERALKAERMRRARAGEPDAAAGPPADAGRGAAVAPQAPRERHPRGARGAAGCPPAAPADATPPDLEPAAAAETPAGDPRAGGFSAVLEAAAGAENRAAPGKNATSGHVAHRAPQERHARGAASATREEKRRGREEEKGVPPPPPPPREPAAAEGAYAALLEAWAPMAAAGHAKPWRSPRPPAELAERLADPGWLELALEAIGRLPACKYFRTPARLDQLCGPGFAENVLAGKYEDLATPRGGTHGEPSRTPPERRRYFRSEFQKSMTDAEYRQAISARKATA